MLSVALLVSAAFTPAVPATIPLAEVEGAEAMGLAKIMLPESVGVAIVGGNVHRLWSPYRTHRISWWTAPRLSGGLCERSAYWTDASNKTLAYGAAPPGAVLTVEPLQHRLQFAFPGARGCETPSGYISPLPGVTAAAIEALEGLRGAMALARGRELLPFQIECRAEDEDRSCLDARAALAGLPLNALGAVDFWPVGMRERLHSEKFDPELRAALARNPPAAEIGFGPTPPDGRSWRVMLETVDGKITRVLLRRTTVIYH